MRCFIIKTLLIVSTILIAVFIISATGNKLLGRDWPRRQIVWQVNPSLPTDEKYQLVAVGNSHAGDGFDFTNYNIPTLNLGEVAARFCHDEALLRQCHRQIADHALIVIDVSGT